MPTKEEKAAALAGLGALIAFLLLGGVFLVFERDGPPRPPPHQSDDMWRLYGRR